MSREECGRALLASTLTDLGSLSDSSWNRSLLKWQMIWTSRQEMRGPQPPFRCSAQHYVRTASWCSKAGHVRSWRCLPPRRASMAMPRLELDLSASCLPHTCPALSPGYFPPLPFSTLRGVSGFFWVLCSAACFFLQAFTFCLFSPESMFQGFLQA